MQYFMITVHPPSTHYNSFLPASPSWDITKICFSCQVNPSGSAKQLKSSAAFFQSTGEFEHVREKERMQLKTSWGTSFLPQLTPSRSVERQLKAVTISRLHLKLSGNCILSKLYF